MQPSEERAARQTRRDYCRGCAAATLHPFHSWVTGDGRENTIRPRAYYRTCSSCGLVVMVLADVTDAEGLARAVLDEHLRPLGGAATAISSPVGPPPLDWDTGLNHLFETCWELYAEKWDPSTGDGGVTFRAYGTGLLRLRLNTWIRDETGDPSERSKGRVHPKAHSASVSVSYDALLERHDSRRGALEGEQSDGEYEHAFNDGRHRRPLEGRAHDHGGLDEVGRLGAGDLADDRSTDLAQALATRSR